MRAKLFSPPKGGHYLLLLSILATGCASPTTAPSTLTPSTFTMTWGGLVFPTTGVGRKTTAPFAVALWNTGTAPVPVAGVSIDNVSQFPFTTTCQLGGTLAANSSCVVTVTFTPNAVGAQAGTLTINANLTTQTFALTGTGATISPQITISGVGDAAPTVFQLFVTGATPAGVLELHTVYTPKPGNPALTFGVTDWTADTTGAVTATVTTESPGTYEHWLIDLTSGIATNHVFHAIP